MFHDSSSCCVLFLIVGGAAAAVFFVHNRVLGLAARVEAVIRRLDSLDRRLHGLELQAGVAYEEAPAPPAAEALPVFSDEAAPPRPSIRDILGQVQPLEAAQTAEPVPYAPPGAPELPVYPPPFPAPARPATPPEMPAAPAAVTPAAPREKRDLEIAIGTGWLSRIGIIAILLALAFLLKHLHDRGILVISPAMCIAGGVLFGAALLVCGEVAHRREYVIQSHALSGGGIVAVYISLWAGLHYYEVIAPTAAFVGMALATVAGACQALRHESEAVACLAWVGGYLVPLLIGDQPGSSSGEGVGPYQLFSYLVMLGLAVLVVAQRNPWPVFAGLSLAGAHVSVAYLHRTSHGSLPWSLGYLAMVTVGMLWVAASRRDARGMTYGISGAMAGYLITIVLLASKSTGPAALPYVYFLALSATLLLLGRIHGWPAVQWCGVLGASAGFLAMYLSHLAVLDHWLLVYGAVSVASALSIPRPQREVAEPLALVAVLAAYVSAALLHESTAPHRVSHEAMLGYLVGLAAATLAVAVWRDWRSLGRVGVAAGLLATGLLYSGTASDATALYGLAYLIALSAAALAIAAWREDETLGVLGVMGAFFGLLATGVMEWPPPGCLVPVYLAVVALACTTVIEWKRWYGTEWLALIGAWGLMPAWRASVGLDSPMPSMLAYAATYFTILLGGSVWRHITAEASHQVGDSALLVANAAAAFVATWFETSSLDNGLAILGYTSIGLAVVYIALGLWAIRRRPEEQRFGSVAVGVGAVLVAVAIPLLCEGVAVTVLWCAESALLMAVGVDRRRLELRALAILVLCAAGVRMLSVDADVGPEGYRILANTRAIGGLAVAAALAVCCALYIRYRDRLPPEERGLAVGFGTVAAALLWWLISAEAWYGTGWRFRGGWEAQHSALSIAWTVYGAAMMAVGLVRRNTGLRLAAMAVFAITVAKVFVFDMAELGVEYRILAFMGLGAVLIAVSFGYQRLVRSQMAEPRSAEAGPKEPTGPDSPAH